MAWTYTLWFGNRISQIFFKTLSVGILFFLGTVTEVIADTDNATTTWTSVGTSLQLDDSWQASFFFEPRTAIDDPAPGQSGNVRQFFSLAAIGYRVNPGLLLSLGYINLAFYGPQKLEHRPIQDLVLQQQSGEWQFLERIRFEERFIEGLSGLTLRGRFLLRAQHPLPFSERFAFVVSEELFLNFNEPSSPSPQSGFDQNRFFAGTRYTFSEKFAFDLGYMNQFIERAGPASSISNHIAFLSLLSRFSLDE